MTTTTRQLLSLAGTMTRTRITSLRVSVTSTTPTGRRLLPLGSFRAIHHTACWNRKVVLGEEIDLADLMQSSKKRKRKKNKQGSYKPSYRFVDQTRVRVVGGIGGKGSLSQQSLSGRKLRPDGGHGGNGGSVLLVADPREQSLRWSQPHWQAEKGSNGSSQQKLGRNGKNLILRVPCGVIVRQVIMPKHEEFHDENPEEFVEEESDIEEESDAGEESDTEDDADDEDDYDESDDDDSSDDEDMDYDDWNVAKDTSNNQGVEFFAWNDDDGMSDSRPEKEVVYLADLDKPGAHIHVARGGRGGLGTMLYASAHGPLPDARYLIKNAQPEPGEVAHLELELKLIADVGLVGFPNAGTL